MLPFEQPAQGYAVTGLVEAQNGDVWLNGSQGIVRIPGAEMKAAIGTSGHRLQSEPIREGDLAGPSSFADRGNTAAINARGRIWFATMNGVISIDPSAPPPRRAPPNVSIRSITVDGAPLDPAGRIPAEPLSITVRYFAVYLSAPEDVVYQYELEGLDTKWQSAGSRTEAVFAHLPPGRYRFRVRASAGDGNWTPPSDSLRFTVLPRFYQTWWFAGAMLALLTAATWLMLAARLRYLSAEIRARAEERAEERIRIARDLHDTLLQGVQGLVLNVHVAAQKLSADADSRIILDRATRNADVMIAEGRDRVSRLRTEHVTDAGLVQSLEKFGADLTSAGSPALACVAPGRRQAAHASRCGGASIYCARGPLESLPPRPRLGNHGDAGVRRAQLPPVLRR